jgi:integrase
VFGDRRVDRITAQDVQAMVVQLHEEGVAPGYLRKVLQATATCLDHAGRAHDNPARNKLVVRAPHAEPEQISPPSADDVLAVLQLLPSKHRLALLFLDWSGARVSSIDTIRIGDYDERGRRIRLRASTTKTRAALWIDLADALADAIEETLGSREDPDTEQRLFASSGADALRTAIGNACRAAGIPVWSPYDLGHRRVSLLHLRGVPWATIGQFVGPRNIAATANVYSHVMLDPTELDLEQLLARHS